MPAPLKQLYLSWQIISTSKEEMQVFLAASPRDTIDALIATLHRAGLDPYLIDLKPLALARVANKATAIIVDAQPTEFDIVIMVDGLPQPVRSLSFPSKASTLSEKLSTILKDLEQTIKFYNSTYSENPLDPGTPIFVSGELAQEPDTYQPLASKLKYPVLPLPPPLECPEGLAPSQYMVNIGLALKELSLPQAEANFSLLNLNFLPEAYKPKPISLTKTLIMPGVIIIAIGLLVPLVSQIQSSAANIASLHGELNTINQLIEQRLAQRLAQGQEIEELEMKVEEAEASRDAFTAVTRYIDYQRYEVNGDLEVTLSVLPDTIDLTNIYHANSELTISGIAPSETEILAYAKNLRGSGKLSQVTISAMKETESGMSFTLTLSAGG